MRSSVVLLAANIALVGLVMGGCNITVNVPTGDDGLSEAGVEQLHTAAPIVQTEDPRHVPLPETLVGQGDTIIVDQSVNVIVNIDEELPVIDLPDSTVLGFDNQTGYDIYIQYYADDEFQGVYVFDGETLLLDYPCLTVVELVSEDDIDPFTGELVDSFVLSDVYLNPDDFICGDALVLTFDAFTTEIIVEYIYLLP